MTTIKQYLIPTEKHAVVKKIWEEMLELSKESGTLSEAYTSELLALNARFGDQFDELAARMTARKRKGSEELCAAVGIPYDPDNGHSLEHSYFDSLGFAFLSVRHTDEPQSSPEAQKLADMVMPEGMKLN